MQTFPGVEGAGTSLRGHKAKLPSTVKYLLSFVTRRKTRDILKEDFVHPTLHARVPNIRHRSVSSANTEDLYDVIDEVVKTDPRIAANRAVANAKDRRVKTTSHVRDHSQSRGSQVDLDERFKSHLQSKSSSNQDGSPREPPLSSSSLRSRNTVSKKSDRITYDRPAINRLPPNTVSYHSHQYGHVVKSSSVCPLLPQIVKTDEKDSKSKHILCCDKCDGKHETEDCPYYKRKREGHIDAQKNGWKLVGGSSNLPGAFLRVARIVPQAGDGSCLFHSMGYGLRDGSDATSLRHEICMFIQSHPHTPICETPLSDWVKWDSTSSCVEYARKMKNGAWGGGIEMACASLLKGCNVHVYESVRSGGYKRISAFDHPIRPELKNTVRILYRGGVHYDALLCGES